MQEIIDKVIKEYEVNTLLTKGKINKAVEQLRSDETLLYVSPTNAVVIAGKKRKKIPGVVVVTDKRIFVYSKILWQVQMESINVVEINSIDSVSNGLTGSKITVNTPSKSIEILINYKSSIAIKVVQLLDDIMLKAKQQAQPQAQINTIDNVEQIKKLSELKELGLISSEEFETKKQELLSRL